MKKAFIQTDRLAGNENKFSLIVNAAINMTIQNVSIVDVTIRFSGGETTLRAGQALQFFSIYHPIFETISIINPTNTGWIIEIIQVKLSDDAE